MIVAMIVKKRVILVLWGESVGNDVAGCFGVLGFRVWGFRGCLEFLGTNLAVVCTQWLPSLVL